MEKLYRGRDIAIDVEADPQAKFRGERQDLEEMAGNLVDNACNGRHRVVFIECWCSGRFEPGAGPMLRDHRRRRRPRAVGERARAGLAPRPAAGTSPKPGSGLGLSIVVDSRGLLRRQPFARQRADRRFAGRTGAARGW